MIDFFFLNVFDSLKKKKKNWYIKKKNVNTNYYYYYYFYKKSRKHLKINKNLSYTFYKKEILNKSPTTKRYLNKIYFS
jgi:hypothetical protein